MFTSRDNRIWLESDGRLRPINAKTSLSDEEASHFLNFLAQNWSLDSCGPSDIFPFSLPIDKSDELILYPGSFSPWHKGHGACIRNAPLDKPLIVMPDHNPWKEVKKDGLWENVKTIWQDIASLKEDCPERELSLFLGFLPLKKHNPTASWMNYLSQSWPDKKLWLLMGEDTFLSLHDWYKVEELLDLLYGIYVCPRGEDKERVAKQRLSLQGLTQRSLLIEELAPHRYEHFSSTFLRESR